MKLERWIAAIGASEAGGRAGLPDSEILILDTRLRIRTGSRRGWLMELPSSASRCSTTLSLSCWVYDNLPRARHSSTLSSYKQHNLPPHSSCPSCSHPYNLTSQSPLVQCNATLVRPPCRPCNTFLCRTSARLRRALSSHCCAA